MLHLCTSDQFQIVYFSNRMGIGIQNSWRCKLDESAKIMNTKLGFYITFLSFLKLTQFSKLLPVKCLFVDIKHKLSTGHKTSLNIIKNCGTYTIMQCSIKLGVSILWSLALEWW
jgi:hypothetical protein